MTRTSVGRFAACLTAGVLAVLLALPSGAVAAVRTARTADALPLRVTIDTLHPSTVPARGVVTITGEITNTSESTWTDLQVYMLRSTTPITSRADLAAAAASDPASQVGSRLAVPGLYDEIGDLAPGESTSYVLSVPRRDLGLSGDPGVYWFGVHVLGAENGIRDGLADGRSRTFLPLLPARAAGTSLALVMPIREPVRRDREGQLLGLDAWEKTLSPDGRLARLLRLSSQATDQPLTWVVDPAVLDAARSVAGQNPPLDIAPTDEGGESPSPSAGASPSDQPSPSDGAGQQATAGALDAASWLQLFQGQASSHTVLTLPYGDLDVAAVMRHRARALLTEGRRLSAGTLAGLGVSGTPVVAPVDGYLPASALRRLPPDHPVLLRDHAFPTSAGPVLSTGRGTPVVLTDSAAGSGGPSPETRYSALAVRQRILSEAALHALSGQRRRPLVVSTPQHWDPGPGWSEADFFGGLDVPWLQLVDVPSVVAGASPRPAPDAPVYRRARKRHEVPFANLVATRNLIDTGDTFARLLNRNDTVDQQLASVAMLASGATARRRPTAALNRARSTTRRVRQLMALVRVEGPPFVTMSSERGPIQITVVNGLDQEVTVAVHADTGSRSLHIASSDPVTLGPGRRASIRLTAKARDIGVHRVVLEATDASGHPLGSTAVFTVRTSQVGLVIWLIIGAGGAVLLAAIVTRVLRRVRRRGTGHGPRQSEGNR